VRYSWGDFLLMFGFVGFLVLVIIARRKPPGPDGVRGDDEEFQFGQPVGCP
jgi:hypothetical protein